MSEANAVECEIFKDHPLRDVNLMKGRSGHLTTSQNAVLKKIVNKYDWNGEYRIFLIPGEHPETCALRWCRARDFDFTETDKMITNHLAWRKTFDIDKKAHTSYNDLLGVDLEKEILPLYPQGFCGQDKCGRLVYVKLVGKLDVTSLLTKIDVDTFVNFEVAMMERSKWLNSIQRAKVKHHVEEYFSIIDLDGFGMSMMKPSVWEFMRTIASQLGDNYPEQNGGMYIINAPWVFKMVWRVVTTFVDAATCAKIKILGSDYKKILLSKVSKDQLPKEYGGTGLSLNEICYSHGKHVYTPASRPTPSEALRGSFDYVKNLDENRDIQEPPLQSSSPTSSILANAASPSRVKGKYEDMKEDAPSPQSSKKLTAIMNETEGAEVKESSELKNLADEKKDDFILGDNNNSECKVKATAKAKPSVPIPSKNIRGATWKNVRQLALGENKNVDFASVVTIKASVEQNKVVTPNDDCDSSKNDKIYLNQSESKHISTTGAADVVFSSEEEEEEDDDDDDEEGNFGIGHESEVANDSEEEYENATDKLLNAYDDDDDEVFLVLENNDFKSPIKHPIQSEPWDIKDNDLNERSCTGGDLGGCVVS
jgi:hypothetical protein